MWRLRTQKTKLYSTLQTLQYLFLHLNYYFLWYFFLIDYFSHYILFNLINSTSQQCSRGDETVSVQVSQLLSLLQASPLHLPPLPPHPLLHQPHPSTLLSLQHPPHQQWHPQLEHLAHKDVWLQVLSAQPVSQCQQHIIISDIQCNTSKHSSSVSRSHINQQQCVCCR